MKKKILMFDLDGVLAESKQDLPAEVGYWLKELSEDYLIAIISGCSWDQMRLQCRDRIRGSIRQLQQFYFLPTSGSQIYDYLGEELFHDALTLPHKAAIWNAFHYCVRCSAIYPETKNPFGRVEEDRGSQITFSLKGQQAPLDVKKAFMMKWDHERHHLRALMQDELDRHFYDEDEVGIFSVRAGGTTSIDVTYAGRDKAFGVTALLQHMGLEKKDALFFGDMLEPGGNDYPVKELGVDCIAVTHYTDTIKILKQIVDGLFELAE